MSSSNENFTSHTIRQQKSDGSFKLRELMVPSDDVRVEHSRMLRMMYSWDIPMPHATGSLPHKTLLDNARPHQDNKHFYMLDLQDAFQNVDIESLISTVRTPLTPKRHHDELELFIREWATADEVSGLPLGAPCSPFLFNLYCVPMDREISRFCQARGITYTRYLDDLTFSSTRGMGKKLRRKLREAIDTTSGMAINHAKSRLHSIENGPVTITGVSIQPDGRMQPSPHFFESAARALDTAELLLQLHNQLDEDELGRLHGYNGALHQLMTQETPTSREFDRRYKEALGLHALKGAQ